MTPSLMNRKEKKSPNNMAGRSMTRKPSTLDKAERQEKITRLQQALADYRPGQSQLIDREKEETLAPVTQAAVRLLNQRARSEQELEQRLLDKGFPERLVSEVIQRCRDSLMLDDHAFAEQWVAERQKHLKRSTAMLRRELQHKGISDSIIDKALAGVDDTEQENIMIGLLEKKAASITTVPADYQEQQKILKRIVGVAARRGFPENQALRHARRILEERINEIES